ncbi:MAG: nucleotidyltransferase domain-containing protein [Nanoarchaeota archaeon]|nr:nucleotidyltransferase domain-containing protein [Nanoarchaeota archaeon]
MIELTKKEQEALLFIYKDISNFYNANSLSKELGITQVGTMKILKRFEVSNILASKKIGKSIVYRVNIEDEFVQKLIAFILINEASKYLRWKDEFESLHKKGRIVLFYGSASRNYSRAKDIDVFLILDEKDIREVNKKIEKIQNILPKKLHVIKATKEDFVRNIKDNNKSMIEIIKTAVVLYGYDEYMEIINGFTSF